VEVDRHQQHDGGAAGGEAGEQAEHQQQAAAELGHSKQDRPEPAGCEAEPFHHARSTGGVLDLWPAVDHERHAADHAEPELGKRGRGAVERGEDRQQQRRAMGVGCHRVVSPLDAIARGRRRKAGTSWCQ